MTICDGYPWVMLAGTRTCCHGYGFSAGVGAGTAQVTHGLPMLCPMCME